MPRASERECLVGGDTSSVVATLGRNGMTPAELSGATSLIPDRSALKAPGRINPCKAD